MAHECKPTMTIITAVNGNRYKPYLMVLLNSLIRVGIDKVIVVYSDVDNIHELQNIFPQITLIEYPVDESGDRVNKIAGKVKYWIKALKNCDDTQIVFVDADTYFLKNSQEVFNDEFDIAYTVRQSRWRINTGVLFAKKRLSIEWFLEEWIDNNRIILAKKELIKKSKVEFGSPDQMGFFQAKEEPRAVNTKLIDFKELPCLKWNMCDCTTNLSDVGILHLKGCLPLLLKERLYGKEYGDERQPSICEGMFDLWRKSYKEILGELKGDNEK